MLLPLVITTSACNSKKDEPTTPDEPSEPSDPVPTPEPPIDKTTRVTISTNYGTERTSALFTYVFDLKDFETIGDEPNANVLKMSMLFDANISIGAKTTFYKTQYPVKGYDDNDSFYQHLGLDDLEKIDVVAKGETDINDISYLNISHKKYEGKDICFVSIIDSGFGTSWNSNFDVGFNGDCYFDKTGEHPEWTNKDNHKGFDIAANRIVSIVEDYKNRVLDENSQQIFYVFGHSRGGALANVSGAKLVDLGYNIASYGLASPAVTMSEDASNEKYNHLYSYINEDDIITGVLSADWGFKRYGRTFSFAITDYKEPFKTFNGFDFPSYSGINLATMLQNMCDGRDEIYEISDEFVISTSTPLQEDKVEDYIEKQLNPLSNKFEYLRNYVEVEQKQNSDNTITVVIKTCPGFLISVLGDVISIMDDDSSSFITEFAKLSGFLDCFLKKAGIKMIDLASFSFDYLVICHSFHSYLTYINLL